MSRRHIAHFAAWVFVFSSCNSSEECPPRSLRLPPPAISTIPEILETCPGRYRLECDLWRDLMPGSSEDGSPLAAIVTLVELDARSVPSYIEFVHLWVVTPQGSWSSRFTDEIPPGRSSSRFSRIARCGPKWPPGTSASAVVTLSCGTDGELHHVKVEGLTIEAEY